MSADGRNLDRAEGRAPSYWRTPPETPEAAAIELLAIIMRAEGKPLDQMRQRDSRKPIRAGILDAYAECLQAANGGRIVHPQILN
jgi:hypothetical protein